MIAAFMFLLLLQTMFSQFCDSNGCLPCYYRCQSCTGLSQNECTSCLQNYILYNGSCIPCTNNCLTCGTDANGSPICQTCNSQFYVAQSTGKCNLCPTGSLTCTFSAVQQCQSGFYLQNSICFYCMANCQVCQNAYNCTTCNSGYYITNTGTCSVCNLVNCLTCNIDGSCSVCISGFYGQACSQKCPSFCSICDSSSCYQCLSTYYLADTGTCEAAGILCSNANGPDSCVDCVSDIAYYVKSACSAFYSVHLTNTQMYYRAPNDIDRFQGGSLVVCPLFNYVTVGKNSISLSLEIQPVYKLVISLQVATLAQESSQKITISSVNLIQTFESNVSSNYSYDCNNNMVVLSNFKATFTPNLSTSNSINQLLLVFAVPSGTWIAVTQVLVQQYLCQISGCGSCETGYTCIKCFPSLLLQDNSCQQICSSGYYLTTLLSTCTLTCPILFYAILQDYMCQPCLSPCLTCTGPQTCLSCQNSWFLLGTSCVLNCPAGYYQNELSASCDSCRYPCLTCENSSTNCTACSLGYLNSIGVCTMSCSASYYQNFSSISCQRCSYPCLTCSFSQYQCNSCSGQLMLNPNGTCLSGCDSNYAQNFENNSCQKCSYPCQTCLNISTQCLSCQMGYAFNMSCVSACPSGYFSDSMTQTCNLCQNNCSTCLTSVQCLSCLPYFYLYSQQQICLQTCPNTTYPSNYSCLSCNSPCSSCSNQTYCLTCLGYLFVYYQGNCLLSCPSFSFLSVENTTKLKICQPCAQNCSSCLNNTFCLQCSDSYLFNSICMTSCPSYTYSYQSQCLNCSFPCMQCLTSDICLSCYIGYYYYSPKYSCRQICPNGYYAQSGICRQCNPQCSLCRNSTLCLTCASNYYQNPDLTCSLSCPKGYYPYTPQSSCKLCSSVCLQCLHSTLCLSCNLSSAYPYLYQYNCLSDCPSGYISNGSNCLSCSPTCATCIYSIDNCTSCNQNLYLLLNSSLNQCFSQCPNGYYPNSATLCIACLSPCLQCLSQTYCLSCIVLTAPLYNGRCLTTCPSTHFIKYSLNQSSCMLCDSNCLSCSKTASNCTSCGPNLFLVSNSNLSICTDTCPKSSYADSLTQTCLSCQAACFYCITSLYCISCISGYYLYINLCLITCPTGYFQNQTYKICQSCTSPCASCLSFSLCITCIKGYFFNQNNSTCMQVCQQRTYAFQTSDGNMQCLVCPVSCLQCYDYSACKSCVLDSSRPYLQGTTCQSTCTDGYFLNLTSMICQTCGWGCLECSSSSCLQCSNSYLYQGACQAQCPISYYQSTAFTCQLCLSPCFQCYDAFNCQYCQSGYFLYLTHCLVQCPAEQWAVTSLSICNQTCSSPLYKIVSSRLCVTSCQLYFDSQGNCVQQCQTNEMINQSLGCESCDLLDCSIKLYFQLNLQQKDGQFQLYLIFNRNIDDIDLFYLSALSISFYSSSSAGWNELQISGLRTLSNEQTSLSDYDIQILSKSPQLIILSINLQQYTQTFSGTINVTVNDLSVFTNQGYPLQMISSTLDVDWFQQSGSGQSATYIGYLIGALFLLTLLLNFVLDNTRAVLHMVEGLQGLHMMIYLQVWYHPLVEDYLLALRFTTFRLPLIQNDNYIWNCSYKYIQVYDSCNALNELILPAMSLFILIVIAVCCHLIKYFSNRHRFLWNHLYNIFWVATLGPAVTSFHYLLISTKIIEICILSLIITAFLILTLVLAFQIIKNVMSGTYADKCFFWGLRKQYSQHPLANLHPLFVLMRRVILAIGIGVADDTPLSCLFILTLLTICIICNIIVNDSFKIQQIPIATAQIVLALLLILMQMYIVNSSKLQNDSWNIFGYSLFALMIIYSILLLVVALRQTYRAVRKHYRKIFQKNTQIEQQGESMKSSNESENAAKQSKNQIQQDVQSEKEQKDDTQHQLVHKQLDRYSNKLKSQSDRASQQFSNLASSNHSRPKADRILIKIAKQKALP